MWVVEKGASFLKIDSNIVRAILGRNNFLKFVFADTGVNLRKINIFELHLCPRFILALLNNPVFDESR